MSRGGIFRDELPGEKKSINPLLMTGYFVAISCMGYMAFYLFVQLSQMDRIIHALDGQTLTIDQFNLLKGRLLGASSQLRNEVIGLAAAGSLVAVIGGIYTFNMVVRPLKALIAFAEDIGKTAPPEIKTNNEIKQLVTAITALASRTRPPVERR
jgi:hypothetical protein